MPARRAAQNNAMIGKRRCLEGVGAALSRRWIAAHLTALVFFSGASSDVLAQDFDLAIGSFEMAQFAIFAGAMATALFSAAFLIRARSKISAENGILRARIADLDTKLSRSQALVSARDTKIVVWDGRQSGPEILGSLPAGCGAPSQNARFLAFGRWIDSRSAGALDHAVDRLRELAEPFDLVIETITGTPLEAQGRTTGSQAFVRFISLGQIRAQKASLRAECARLESTIETLQSLMDAVSMPIWLRDGAGELVWVNRAYAQATSADNAQIAINEHREFLSAASIIDIRQAHERGEIFSQRVSALVAGHRRFFHVDDALGEFGSAGLAADISETEEAREDLVQAMKSHAETFDHLRTAVAVFDVDARLKSYNQTFAGLWSLPAEFLDSAPSNEDFLDRLRSEGRLAEQPRWREWKDDLLSVYRGVEPGEHLWHLPDGQTLRVVAKPHPKGGVTWVFENLTERFDLESRYNALIRVQGETIDHLAEGVAVFGPDARLRLANPALAVLWSLEPEQLAEGVHIRTIAQACERGDDSGAWDRLADLVTSYEDARVELQDQCELSQDRVLEYALMPLPNGQSMVTFVDVSDRARAERALVERNEALVAADRIKNEFVQHVSYELRTPLTNIIGFTELLKLPGTPIPEEKQIDYLDHISASAEELRTIVDDILDLATVDAGIMELECAPMAIGPALQEAAQSVAERLDEHDLKLDVQAAPDLGKFIADEDRIRQILFNLLSNAANYAPAGTAILLSCHRTRDEIVFCVEDKGPGIPDDVLAGVFDRFQTHRGGRSRGAGLGLSVVQSFVNLHGGTVEIKSAQGSGTRVICRFPSVPEGYSAAAE